MPLTSSNDNANVRALIERIPDGIALHREGRFVYANAAWLALLGYRSEELVGEPITVVVPADGKDSIDEGPSSDEPAKPTEAKLVRRDGSPVEVEVSKAQLLIDGAKTVAIIARDITERKQIDARLRMADRVASVGTLAAGVAHEINNPLAYVMANLQFVADALEHCEDVLPNIDELREALRDARQGAARVHAIVLQLRSFGRGDEEGTRAPLDVRRAIEDAERIASVELRHRARVVKGLAQTPLVDANAGQLMQVFLNLLVNAAQAIPEGSAHANEVRIRTRTSETGRVVVEVSDTGTGMTPEVQARIFDPFFTTKPVGVGTGLGLSVCIGIVTALGGEMKVESAPGRGSTFTVILPPAAPRPESPELARSEPAPVRRGRVLVIDDEPLVGTAIRRALGAHHDIEVVTSARAALGRIASGEPFDAVICDLIMPEMSGMQLHAHLAATSPTLADRVIFITGGAFTPAATEFLARVKNPRLEKPLDVRALRRVLRDWLE